MQSLTTTAPASIRRATASPWPCPWCRPRPGGRRGCRWRAGPPPRHRATFMIGSVGPNVSSRHALHRVVDVGQHGRLEEACPRRAAVTAGQHLRALRDRVVDVLLDDVDLGRVDERADVDDAEAARHALAQLRAPSRRRARRTRRGSAPRRRRARPRCTSGPPFCIDQNTAALAARSRSASARTIIGSLPPSSSETGVSVFAARSITSLPVSVEPVNMTKSTRSISVLADRARGRRRPGRRPAECRSRAVPPRSAARSAASRSRA